MSHVLVTGATGFVGRALVPALISAGHRVRAAVRDPSRVASGAEVSRIATLAEPVPWDHVVDGIEVVVHLAGLAHATRDIPDDVYDRINRLRSEELAHAARRAGVRRFVYVSSIRAQTGPIAARSLSELDEPRPSDAYGRSKLAAEAAIRASGIAHTILRPVLIYGRGVKGNLAALAKVAALPLPLPFAGFRNRRSLLSLDRMVTAITHTMSATGGDDATFVVADSRPISVAEIVAAFRVGHGRDPMLFEAPRLASSALQRIIGEPRWERLAGELVVDPTRLIATGWQPVVDTRAELVRLATW